MNVSLTATRTPKLTPYSGSAYYTSRPLIPGIWGKKHWDIDVTTSRPEGFETRSDVQGWRYESGFLSPPKALYTAYFDVDVFNVSMAVDGYSDNYSSEGGLNRYSTLDWGQIATWNGSSETIVNELTANNRNVRMADTADIYDDPYEYPHFPYQGFTTSYFGYQCLDPSGSETLFAAANVGINHNDWYYCDGVWYIGFFIAARVFVYDDVPIQVANVDEYESGPYLGEITWGGAPDVHTEAGWFSHGYAHSSKEIKHFPGQTAASTSSFASILGKNLYGKTYSYDATPIPRWTDHVDPENIGEPYDGTGFPSLTEYSGTLETGAVLDSPWAVSMQATSFCETDDW